MRITGGTYRGRALLSPPDDRVRPTSDRARLAIFNMLESRGALRGAVVLDLFCGTGALGIEALSRGAESCLFIDAAPESITLTQKNAQALGVSSLCAFRRETAAPLGAPQKGDKKATLVFMDPPYSQELVIPALCSLVDFGWLAPQAWIVVEAEKGWTGDFPPSYTLLTTKTYGAAQIFLLGVTQK